jgi:heme/copper-type cytochrome/quinol oxidase subunit 3
MQRDLLEEQLTDDELLALRNKRAGMFIFQVSWIMAFVCMVIVNWQMRFSPGWTLPEDGGGWLVATFATGVLLVSAWFARRGLRAVQAGDGGAFLAQWLGAVGLGVLFVALMIYEWLTVTGGVQYVQVFRLMTGFHGFHALVIGAYMVYVYRDGRRGRYDRLDFWPVEAGAKLWYFVVVAWIMFYVVIYWI